MRRGELVTPPATEFISLLPFIAAAPPPPLMFELDPAAMMTAMAMGWTPGCKGTPWGRTQAVVDQEIMGLGISTGLFG